MTVSEGNKHRVLIVTDVTSPGGVDRYIIDLVRIAKQTIWEIVVLMDLGSGSDQLFGALLLENIQVYRTGLYHQTTSLTEIEINSKKFIEHINPGLVHVVCGSPRSAIIPRKVTLERKIPLFFTEQYVDPNLIFESWQFEYLTSIYNQASGVIIVCEENKNLLTNHYKLKSNKIKIIPNSVITNESHVFKPYTDKIIFKIVSVGRLTAQKGFDDLIKGIFLLGKNERDKIKLSIYGEGDEKQNLLNLVKMYNLNEVIYFLGWDNNVINRYAEFDLFILASRYEGQPFVLLEAISKGLPCIATHVSGVSEIFANGKYGTFIKPNDPQSVAQALSTFIKKPKSFYKKSGMALRHIQKNHDLYINTEILFSMWKSVI